MEIKVGDYYRTKAGYIGERINISDFRDQETKICVDFGLLDYIFIGKKDITKHSPNIIDLVEVGDYVNGYKVLGKEGSVLYTEVEGINRSHYHIPISQYVSGIKTILTHELYEANCYKVGGEDEF